MDTENSLSRLSYDKLLEALGFIQSARDTLADIKSETRDRREKHEQRLSSFDNGLTKTKDLLDSVIAEQKKQDERINALNKAIADLANKVQMDGVSERIWKLNLANKLKLLALAIGTGAVGGGVVSYKEVLAFIKSLL